ncbi:MAG: DUF6781 family protein [Phycisphaeraceae bacterium]
MNDTPHEQEHENAQGPQPGQQASDEAAAEAAAAAGEQAERIAAEGEDIRGRVRQLVVDTVQQRKLSFEQLGQVGQEVLRGAASGVKQAGKEEQRQALRAVIDGLADSYATAANATRLALEEANARRRTFAQEDLQHAVRELKVLDERFLRMVGRTTERAWGTLTEQAKALKDHAQHAAQGIRPSMESALHAARHQPGKLAGEAASAGFDATRHTAGTLLQAMAGLLQGAGEALSRPREGQDKQGK